MNDERAVTRAKAKVYVMTCEWNPTPFPDIDSENLTYTIISVLQLELTHPLPRNSGMYLTLWSHLLKEHGVPQKLNHFPKE